MCFTLRLHMSAAPTQGGLTQALGPMSNINMLNDQKLLDLLDSAASYNDKGFIWCGHSHAKIEEMQHGFHRDQLALAKQIGIERLGAELQSAIESGAASRDGSGDYCNLAAQVLGVHRS
jgi:hypothetical protein